MGKTSITRETLVKMGIRIALIIITTTAISYLHLMSTLREQVVEQLEKYISERGKGESTLFQLAHANLTTLGKELRFRLDQSEGTNPVQEFNRKFVRSPDGVIRNRPANFDGRREGGIYIDKSLPVNAQLRRRILIYYDLVTQYGPAWNNRFINTYIDTSENIMAVYWPGNPTWAQDVAADYYMPNDEYIYHLDEERNFKREIKWTGMFFDVISKKWMVSVGYPVYREDEHVANIGHDVLLDSLMKSTINEHLHGAYNLIFRNDGRLIAHPDKMKEIKKKAGEFNILYSDDHHLRRIFRLVKEKPEDQLIVANEEDEESLAVTKIAGPDWFFVTVYPDVLITERAFETARFILFLGLLSLLVEVCVLYFVLRRQIADPLAELITATDHIAMEDYDIHLDTERTDELGSLANSFSTMASAVQTRQDSLKAAHHSLEKANRLKDQFLANTSHELRTPLNGMIGIAESLVDGAAGRMGKAAKNNLNLIVVSGRRLTSLVNDLLDFSKLKEKDIELTLKSVSLREMMDVVLTISVPLIGKKKLNLVNAIAGDLPVVKVDENRLQQVLLNLIGNAIKFTESGEVRITAKHLPETTNLLPHGSIEVCIADTGIGIPEDKLDSIFESFEQGDGDTARKYGGTGLGLSISKQLVELHGGTIRVASTLGQGSQFYFNLSATDEFARSGSHQETEQVYASTEKQFVIGNKPKKEPSKIVANSKNAKAKKAPEVQGRNKIVLVVDDELVNRQVLANHLSLRNFEILSAENGMEALEVMETTPKRPDLVLLDVMMPGMSGLEVCAKIRERYTAGELPILLLTAKNQSDDLVEGLGSGANDYITKPFSRHELMARINTHLQLAHLSSSLSRFVPFEFLQKLGKTSILDVHLGDTTQGVMTVLFSDIRSFTTLSEAMTPVQNFEFINTYLGLMSPLVNEHNGFIDKFIGDAIMALFLNEPDDAVRASIEMQRDLRKHNVSRMEEGLDPIRTGIGLNTGKLMLGTVGTESRMEGTVISDAVNLASRLESLTKEWQVSTILSEFSFASLVNPESFCIRILGRVKVKGKTKPVLIYEVFDSDQEEIRDAKNKTKAAFEEAVQLYLADNIEQALRLTTECLHIFPDDNAAHLLQEHLHEKLAGAPLQA